MTLPRRSFLTGLAALISAPAIARATSIMAVKSVELLRQPATILPGHITYVRHMGAYEVQRRWDEVTRNARLA